MYPLPDKLQCADIIYGWVNYNIISMSIETLPRDVNYLKEVFAGNGGVPIWLSFGFRSGTAVDCALDGEWPDSTPAEDCFFKDLAFDDVILKDQGMRRS